MHSFFLTNSTTLPFIKFNNGDTRHLNGPNRPEGLFHYFAVLPGVYLNLCMYMSPALIRINTVYVFHPLIGSHGCNNCSKLGIQG